MNAIRESIDDDELLRAFEDCTLPPAQFSHRLHLAFGWRYLQRHGFAAGAALFCERLRTYVTAVGAATKYHETITWAYLVLMNEERVLHAQPDECFDSMIARRPDLLDHRHGALPRCYPGEQLESETARRVFTLPRISAPLASG